VKAKFYSCDGKLRDEKNVRNLKEALNTAEDHFLIEIYDDHGKRLLVYIKC